MSGRAACILALFMTTVSLNAQYVLSPRDTGMAPGQATQVATIGPEYSELAETENLRLFYREDRGVFAIEDRRNGYVWKTGLDIPFNRDIDDMLDDGADPLTLPPLEERLNTTFTGIANSLVSIEYVDAANNPKRIGSSARSDVRSEFTVKSRDPFAGELYVEFEDVDISLLVELALEHDDLVIRLDNDNVRGAGTELLMGVILAPFMGASGGRQLLWSEEQQDFEISRAKPMTPGYVVVPDGSGALVRFADNSSELSAYFGPVYGFDFSQWWSYRSFENTSVPFKNNYMPLFGVVHGQCQNAFAGFAAEGGEYMGVGVVPEENVTHYTNAHPIFVYNLIYYQVYNTKGDGYFRALEERNEFDIEFRYRFLACADDEAGGGSPDGRPVPEDIPYRPDYTGIARAYRDYLKTRDVLPDRDPSPSGHIPLRVDFLMADVRESVVGLTHEVTTTIAQVDAIVADLEAAGINDLSVGLLGYARGGTVRSKPGTVRLLGRLGSPREFRDVIGSMTERGIDVSFGRDYAKIGDGQVTLWGNATRGATGWYNERLTFEANAPVNLFYFARPHRVTSWLLDEGRAMADLGATSHSIDGIGHTLISDYSESEVRSAVDTRDRYVAAIAEDNEILGINLYRPNQYLWKYTDRFLHAPMFSSQYLLETDTVPVLQMVLHGTMDVFAPYSNFSFYSDEDVLRMIDYNVYPSFLLTHESAHLLLMTNSAEYYSTEYALYRDLIDDVYHRVDGVLRHVMDASWTGREVLDEGFILNTYDNGVRVLINYTPSEQIHAGETVPPLSARAIRPDSARTP